MIYLGIDPGQSGCVVEMGIRSESETRFHDMPYNGNDLDRPALLRLLQRVKSRDTVHAAIEKQQPMPSQGVVSVFTLGDTFGQLKMALAAESIPFDIPRPTDWHKDMGIPAKTDKAGIVAIAANLFPTLASELRGPRGGLLDGRADALLLAEWLRRTLNH